MTASNRPDRTDTYVSSVDQSTDWCEANDADPFQRSAIEGYLAQQADTRAPATVAFRYRSLQQFFKWLELEEEVDHSPMTKMRPPKVPEQPVPRIQHPDHQRERSES